MTDSEKSNSAKVFNTLSTFFQLAIFVLAIYLAIRDMSLQASGSTKVWVFLLAVFEPTLYVLLHGISTSLNGTSFFQSSPIVGSPMPLSPGSFDMGSMGGSALPKSSTMGSTIDDMMPPTVDSMSSSLGL